MKIEKSIVITPADGPLDTLYRKLGVNYPRYFKMDTLCKLGFVASELLLKDEPDRFVPRDDRAVLLFSRVGPLCNDRRYMKTIRPEEYFPSPSLFVYTLANTVTGEIAIRNKYLGDTTAYGLPAYDAARIFEVVETAFKDGHTTSALCGWMDCRSDTDYEARISYICDF